MTAKIRRGDSRSNPYDVPIRDFVSDVLSGRLPRLPRPRYGLASAPHSAPTGVHFQPAQLRGPIFDPALLAYTEPALTPRFGRRPRPPGCTLRSIAPIVLRNGALRRAIWVSLFAVLGMGAGAGPVFAQPPKVKLTIRNASTIVEDRALVVRARCDKPCQGTLRARFGPRQGRPYVATTFRVARKAGTRTLRLRFSPRMMSAIRQRIVPLYLAQVELRAHLRDVRGNLRRTSVFENLALRPRCDVLAGVVAESSIARLSVVYDGYNFYFAVACARGSRNLRTILNDSFDGQLEVAVANGPMIAVATTTWPDGNQIGMVYDAVNNRVIRDLANSDAFIRKLVVTTEGHSAYMQVRRLGGPSVEADDASGHRILDSGPGIDVHSLRLDGHVITWTNAGEQRSAMLG